MSHIEFITAMNQAKQFHDKAVEKADTEFREKVDQLIERFRTGIKLLINEPH